MSSSDFPFAGLSCHSEQLARIDQDWARLVESVPPGPSPSPKNVEPFEALAQAIASQHLNPHTAACCVERLVARFPATPFPTARDFLGLEVFDLEGFGFSREKSTNLRKIAEAAASGRVPSLLEAVRLSDDELIARIAGIDGIGRWTADMFLIESLGRLDVMPAEDFGVCEGYRNLKGLSIPPTPRQMRAIATNWSPLRTTAAWYLKRCKSNFREWNGLTSAHKSMPRFTDPGQGCRPPRMAPSARSTATI